MQATELAPTYRSNPIGDDLDVACALDPQSMADLGRTGIVRDGRPRFAQREDHRKFGLTLEYAFRAFDTGELTVRRLAW